VAVRTFESTAVQHAVAGLLALGFSAAFSTAAWAVDPPNAAQGLESLPPATAPTRGEIDPVAAPAAPVARSAAPDGPTVRVASFAFSGNTVFTSEALSAMLQGYQQRDLTLDELNEATAVVQAAYRDQGYFLAQAVLPAQKPANGLVVIRVIEGTVGATKVNLQPGTRISQAQADGYMALLPSGSAITERGVERPLLLLSDLPGVSVNSVLKPGATPGSADLVVDVSSKGNPLGGSVFLENHSSKYTGRYRLGLNVEARSVLGFGEVLSLTAMQSAGGTTPAGETKVARLGLVLPVGKLGTKVAFGYTDFEYEVGGPFANTKPVGVARVASMLVQHPYIRSRNATHFFHAGFDHKLADDRLADGATILARRELQVYHLGVNGDFRDNFNGGGLNSYNLRATFGENSIKNNAALVADQAPSTGLRTNGSFTKLRGDYLRLQKLNFATPGHALMLSVRTQLAMNNLDGSEKMSLGGPNGVRAYSVGAASADDAFLGTVEYRYTIPSYSLLGGSVTLSSFYDHGTAKLNHKPAANTTTANRVTLSSLGVGVNWLKRNDFQMRLDVASRMGSESYKGDNLDSDTRWWLSLQKWF
jgi:hemolysin activation/secretion protein